jgi:hypothetical protein
MLIKNNRNRPTFFAWANKMGRKVNALEIIEVDDLVSQDVNFRLAVDHGDVVVISYDSYRFSTVIQEEMEQRISEISVEGTNKVLLSLLAGEDLPARTAVYLEASNVVKKAKADSELTMPCIGFVVTGVISGASVNIVQAGGMSGFTGLVAQSPYFISDATAGEITDIPITTSDHYLQNVGVGKTATDLAINLGPSIKRV